jgi:GNAT superfamily N-acetyltransferase
VSSSAGVAGKDTVVVVLADRPELAHVAAAWLHAEWGGHDGESLREVQARLERRMGAGAPVVTWLALADGDPVGTASLLLEDNPIGPSPLLCLTDLVVVSAQRGQGIGKALCVHALAHARRQGLGPLHAFTRERQSFLHGLGWSEIAETVMTLRGLPVAARLLASP